MKDDDAEILHEFILETREHLAEIEPDLLAMEEQGKDVSQDIINRVFRAVHSTKGGASFLGIQSLTDFSHTMENVLMQLRDGELTVTSELTDVLLRSVDVLRAMVEDLDNSDKVDCSSETADLTRFLEIPAAAGSSGEPEAGEPDTGEPEASVEGESAAETDGGSSPDADGDTARQSVAETLLLKLGVAPEKLATAFAQGMRLYKVNVLVLKDLGETGRKAEELLRTVEKVGLWLGSSKKVEGLDPKTTPVLAFYFLCATVLTADMLAMALKVAEERCEELDTTDLKKRLAANKQSQAAQPKREEPKATESKGDQKKTVVERPVGGKSEPERDVKETLRVRVDLLTKLMNMAGELVLGRNQLLRALDGVTDDVAGLAGILQHVDRVTTELQEGIMQTRMQPIGGLFSRYSRVVRDLARGLGKEVELVTEGGEVELDKSIIELLADPLTHIVRNCMDHGIESPDDREKIGKARKGRITMIAFHQGNQVNIAISDDGKGIKPEKVMAKALANGVADRIELERMTERELINLVMAPGFSTAEKVSDISGRGVGMDVVRSNIEKLGGDVELEAPENEGTTVLLRLPLTLAIIPALVVGVGDSRFAVPQVSIVELVLVRAAEVRKRIEYVREAPVLRLRGRLLPIVKLADILKMRTEIEIQPTEHVEDRRRSVADRRREGSERSVERRRGEERRQDQRSDYYILVLRAGANQFGVIVDEVFESEEIVVKPLSTYLKDIRCFAGTTILGDGRVIMILDTIGLAELAHLRFLEIKREEEKRLEADKVSDGGECHSIILFNSGPDELFAFPQDKVLRLERIQRKDIKQIGSQEFINYRGHGLPLLRLDSYLPVQPVPDDAQQMYILIPKLGASGEVARAQGGIIASRIVDAMDVNVKLQAAFFTGPGLQGAAIIEDQLTVFIDPSKLLESSGVLVD